MNMRLPTFDDHEDFKNFRAVRKTLGELLDETSMNKPDKEALICDESRITYFQFSDESNRIAKGFIEIGVQKGDRVAILMENNTDWPIIAFALFKIGAIVVGCNTRFNKEELKYVLNRSETKILIMSVEFKETNISFINILHELAPELPKSNPDNLELEQLPYLKKVIIHGSEYDGCITFENLIAKGSMINDQILEERKSQVKPDDPANMIFTSGTTGFPKGCVLKHTSWITGQKAAGILLNITENDKLLCSTGYFTTYATAMGMALPVIFGMSVVIHKVFDAQMVLETIEKEKITTLMLVPTMLVKLFEHPKFKTTDLTSLRTGNIGGTAVAPEMLIRARSTKKGWGLNAPDIVSIYGMTETHGTVTLCSTKDSIEKVAYTVGKVIPLIDVRVVNPLTGEDVGFDQEGELLLKGDCVMKEYFKDPEQTKDALRQGWLHTKDLVTFDKDGYMRVVGRSSDMIITGGFNVYPKEIENKIIQHPKVMDVTVFRIPDEIYGEVPAAYIILKSKTSMNENEIIEFCKQNMAKYKIPKYIKFVSDFPVNPGGKVQKFLLIEEVIKELGLKKK